MEINIVEDKSKISQYIFENSIHFEIFIGVFCIVFFNIFYFEKLTIIVGYTLLLIFFLHYIIQLLPNVFYYNRLGSIKLRGNKIEMCYNNGEKEIFNFTNIKNFTISYNGISFWDGVWYLSKVIVYNYIRFNYNGKNYEFKFLSRTNRDKKMLIQIKKIISNTTDKGGNVPNVCME